MSKLGGLVSCLLLSLLLGGEGSHGLLVGELFSSQLLLMGLHGGGLSSEVLLHALFGGSSSLLGGLLTLDGVLLGSLRLGFSLLSSLDGQVHL